MKYYKLLLGILLIFLFACRLVAPIPSTDIYEMLVDEIEFIPVSAMDCVYKAVPELSDYEKYISDKSGGKAHLTVSCDSTLQDLYKDGDYVGKYYWVYVGEQWEDRIDYYDTDLNSDGVIDKLVVFDSFGYAGTAGELFDILIGGANGEFTDVSNYILQLIGQDDSIPDAEFFISDVMTNGFYNIIIKHDGEVINELAYEAGAYSMVVT